MRRAVIALTFVAAVGCGDSGSGTGVSPIDGGIDGDASVAPDGGVSPDGSVSPDGGVAPDGGDAAAPDSGSDAGSAVCDPGGSTAAGGGPAPDFSWDPCAVPPPGYNVIQGTAAGETLTGTTGNDLIYGHGGDDEIHGLGGDDILCGGNGEDLIYGGAGNDYLDGGADNDTLYGDDGNLQGGGNDAIFGRAGSDLVHGEGGNDRIYGGILDDMLYGDDGDDLIIGGHGSDRMHGGTGNDWLRGDTGRDEFVGGAGNDTASFATATPPGQAPGSDGVDADLNEIYDYAQIQVINQTNVKAGRARGDGTPEPLLGIENVVGSPFADAFAGPGNFAGGYGADSCDGAACDAPCESTPLGLPYVFVDARSAAGSSITDVGLVVLGSPGDDQLTLTVIGNDVVVTSDNAAPLTAGPNCTGSGTSVTCTIPATLSYVLAWGAEGNDTITLGTTGWPNVMTAVLDGGPGDDVLIGSRGEDVMLTGESGHDKLYGGNGDDALMSEALNGNQDGDEMYAEGGNDQLVTDYPCGGHFYSGGPGIDIAGFARAGPIPIRAQLAGPADNVTPFHGAALAYDVASGKNACGPAQWTRFSADSDLEILEGAAAADELWGNNDANVIWARDGNDSVWGLGGNDELWGHTGNDTIYGGLGADSIYGGAGFDSLFASDGAKDQSLSCGADGGKLETYDAVDLSVQQGCSY